MQNSSLIIGIPSNHRLLGGILERLRDAGFVVESPSRKSLNLSISNGFDIQFALIRSRDIPRLVSRGCIDGGITTHSTIFEMKSYSMIDMHQSLNLGKYSMVLASSHIHEIERLVNTTIATSHPNIAKRYFKEKGIPVKILPVQGSVEMYALLGIADAIIDISSTGETLRAHGLTVIDQLFSGQVVFVSRKGQSVSKRGKLLDFYNALVQTEELCCPRVELTRIVA